MEVVSENDIISLCRKNEFLKEIFETMRTCFIQLVINPQFNPPRIFVPRHSPSCQLESFLSMSAYYGGYFVNKMLHLNSNRQPFIKGTLALFEEESGAMKAVMECECLTAYRTAAGACAIIELLARCENKRPLVVVVIGFGAVGQACNHYLSNVYEGHRVYCLVRNGSRSNFTSKTAILVEDLQEIGENIDVVVTCTSSRSAVITMEMIENHIDQQILFIVLGGVSSDATWRELDDKILHSCELLLVDDEKQTMAESADVRYRGKIDLSVGELLQMETQNRTSLITPCKLIVCKLNGFAMQDAAAAATVLKFLTTTEPCN